MTSWAKLPPEQRVLCTEPHHLGGGVDNQQCFIFKGIHYGLTAFRARPTEENWLKVISVTRFFKPSSLLLARALQSILGMLMGQSRLLH